MCKPFTVAIKPVNVSNPFSNHLYLFSDNSFLGANTYGGHCTVRVLTHVMIDRSWLAPDLPEHNKGATVISDIQSVISFNIIFSDYDVECQELETFTMVLRLLL